MGGRTLTTGVYKWGTNVLIPTKTTLVLTGSSTDVFIFQISQDLIMDSAATVQLDGGVLAENVFWQVTGLVDFGTATHLEGVVLTSTSIALKAGASVNGRLLAQTAITLINNAVIEPN